MKKLLNFFSHFFLPSEKNNFRGRSLHLDFLTLYLIFALLLTFSFKRFNLTNVLGFATDITIEKLYQLTNQKRQEHHLPPLQYNEKLALAAARKASDMFTKNYWSHFAPDGTSPWSFILAAGYQYEYAGENLAKNFLFSQGVIDAWMNSETHRNNILRSDYTDVGFAVVNGVLNGEETTLVVQMFGKPLTLTKGPKTLPIETVSAEENLNLNKKLPAQSSSKAKTVNLAKFSFDFNFVFVSFLIIALIMDLYFALRFNVLRFRSKTLAHLIFLFFILLGLTLFTKGAIL